MFNLIISLLLLGCLLSCKTTKEVIKIETRYDSTAIKENAALKRVLKEELERFEREKENWDSTGIVFYETLPCPDSSSKPQPTKIIFDNGRLRSIEGNVRSLNQTLYEKSAELIYAHSVIDSLSLELEKSQTDVSKKETIKYVDKVTKIKTPWWLYVLIAAVSLLIEHKVKIVGNIWKLISLIKK